MQQKTRYSIRYQVESLPLDEIEKRKQAGQRFGCCDALAIFMYEADDTGEFRTLDFHATDGRGQEPNPGRLSGKQMSAADLFRAWALLAKVIERVDDESKSLLFEQRRTVALARERITTTLGDAEAGE